MARGTTDRVKAAWKAHYGSLFATRIHKVNLLNADRELHIRAIELRDGQPAAKAYADAHPIYE